MTFDVTPDEANLIGEGLGLLPFGRVAQLMGKLQQQAQAQQQPKVVDTTDSPDAVIEPKE